MKKLRWRFETAPLVQPSGVPERRPVWRKQPLAACYTSRQHNTGLIAKGLRVMAHHTECPPHSRGRKHSVAVVDHHVCVVSDAHGTNSRGKHLQVNSRSEGVHQTRAGKALGKSIAVSWPKLTARPQGTGACGEGHWTCLRWRLTGTCWRLQETSNAQGEALLAAQTCHCISHFRDSCNGDWSTLPGVLRLSGVGGVRIRQGIESLIGAPLPKTVGELSLPRTWDPVSFELLDRVVG